MPPKLSCSQKISNLSVLETHKQVATLTVRLYGHTDHLVLLR